MVVKEFYFINIRNKIYNYPERILFNNICKK